MRFNLTFFISIAFGILVFACKGSEEITNPVSIFEQKIKDAPNNLERFYQLHIGDFMYYSYRNGDSANIQKGLVNDGQDSVIRMVRPVGNKNKEGYWLFDYTCSTNLPETPLVQFFQKIEQVSRDTLIAYVYNPEIKVPIEKLVNNQLDNVIDLDEVQAKDPLKTVVYIKVDAQEFKYEEPLREYRFSKSDDETYLSQVVSIGLSGHEERANFYNLQKVKTGSLTNFQKRLINFDSTILLFEEEE